MQIKPEQILSSLEKKPLPLVWVSGDEPLLVQECCDEVRAHARANGVTEREVFEAGAGFDWNGLLQSASTLSLFAERRLLDLRLPSMKLDEAAKSALGAYAADPGQDNLLLITSPKVDKAMTRAKWFSAIESRGYFVQLWPIKPHELPQWIGRRLRKHGLEADQEAVRLLAERVEGNLLAAAQEVEKLAMRGEGRIDSNTVMRSVADSARFNVYELLDAAMAGQAARSLKILYHLRAEGAEPLKLLNVLCIKVRQLALMCGQVERGRHVNEVMQAERIWSSHKSIYNQALRQHSAASLSGILKDAQVVDLSVKGILPNNPWDELASLLLRLARLPLAEL